MTQLVTTVATTVEWHVITVVEKSPPVTVTVTATDALTLVVGFAA